MTDRAGNFVEQTFVVTVEGVNAAPIATEQRVRVQSNGSLAIALAGDDGDPDAVQTLSFALAGSPSHGQITGFNPATGTLTYTPDADYFGSDSFTFTVTDDAQAGAPASLTSSPAEVEIVVTVHNDVPVANAQSATTAEDTPLALSLTGQDGNAQIVQTLTYAIAQQPSHGTLSGFNSATGAVTYTPAANYNGPDSFQFTVTDDDQAEPPSLTSAAATVSLNVTAVNDPPAAAAQSVATGQDAPLQLTLSGSDGDPETVQTLTYAIVNGPSHGTLTGFDPATGAVLYTPSANYSGPDSFTFTVTDDNTAGGAALTSSPATIAIQVAAINSPPVANAKSVALDEDQSLAIALVGDDGDGDIQQVLKFQIVAAPAHGTLSGFNPGTGTVTYTPAANYSGSDSFTFTVTDDAQAGTPANLTSSPAQVSITINPVDDAPRFAAAGPQVVFQTQQLSTSVSASIVDGPGYTVRYSLDPGAPQGMAIHSSSGEITWQVPDSFPAGRLQVTVRATEINPQGEARLSATQSLAISVVDRRVAALALALAASGSAQPSILGVSLAGIAIPLGSVLPSGGLSATSTAGLSTNYGPLDDAGPSVLLNSQSLGHIQIGPDTTVGRGLLPNADLESGPPENQGNAEDQPPPDAKKANPPTQATPAPAKKKASPRQSSQPPAQNRRNTPRANDLALESLAAVDYLTSPPTPNEATAAAIPDPGPPPEESPAPESSAE